MLEKFVEELLKEKQMPDNIDPQVKSQLIKDLSAKAEDLINRRMLDSLSDEQTSEFGRLLDSQPSPEAVADFVNKNIKNKEEITASALLEFRELYLGPSQ